MSLLACRKQTRWQDYDRLELGRLLPPSVPRPVPDVSVCCFLFFFFPDGFSDNALAKYVLLRFLCLPSNPRHRRSSLGRTPSRGPQLGLIRVGSRSNALTRFDRGEKKTKKPSLSAISEYQRQPSDCQDTGPAKDWHDTNLTESTAAASAAAGIKHILLSGQSR